MIYLLSESYVNLYMALGVLFTFAATMLATAKLKDKLPADEGRDFAVDGKLSKGKPRGAGIIFIFAFAIGALLFLPITLEVSIYIGLVVIEMLTGFFDDASDKPWGRLKKGLLDFVVSLILIATFIYYNGTELVLPGYGELCKLPVWLFAILGIGLIWLSINATNCADGVDGLSGTLTIITILSFYILDLEEKLMGVFSGEIIIFIAALLAYLWYNAGPSILMMGDAGSRAMGIFIAIVALKSRMPLLYVVFALVLMCDGAIGLLKITIIKVLKVNPMKNLRTPLHDHVRKNLEKNWANNQCVMRFDIIQAVVSIIVIFLIKSLAG